jgi:uncharacterized protein with ATP-grasp and redox domains
MRGFLCGKEMKVHGDCFPCFRKQVDIALNLGTRDESLKERVVDAVLEEIKTADNEKTPAHFTSRMHRTIRDMMGSDPFGEIKSEYNSRALGLYPALSEMAAKSPDSLLTASRLAIAGNVIDFGIFASVDIEGAVQRALENPLAVDDYPFMRAAVEAHEKVLYLLDNAGEAVFDRILIEGLVSMDKRVTAVVKGGPVINDCTWADAVQAGITGLCEVIDNGSDAVGTILEKTSKGFRKRFYDKSALVISKGQGNLETLLDEEREIFFLFQSKCGVLSGVLGVEEGAMLLAGNRCGL